MPFDHWVPVKKIADLLGDLEDLLARVQQQANQLSQAKHDRADDGGWRRDG